MTEEEVNAEVSQEVPKTIEERMDDLEDLISVEQAGVIELKKMLESGAVSAQSLAGESAVPSDLVGRLQTVESGLELLKQQASSIPVAGAMPSGELEQKIAQLDIVKNNLEASQKAVDENLKNSADALKSLQNLRTVGGDVSRQAARIEGFYETMNKNYSGMEKRISSIESKIEKLRPENTLSSVQSLFNQLNEKIESRLNETEESLNQRVQEAQNPITEDQVKQLIEKVVQLETRILALEKMSKQAVALSPVILE